jgi:hypothetical protein
VGSVDGAAVIAAALLFALAKISPEASLSYRLNVEQSFELPYHEVKEIHP